jgi:hypothetical protein
MASSHLKALLRKNRILWQRNIICSILEILVPLVFCLLFKLFRDKNPPKEIPEISYYSKPLTLQTSPGFYQLKGCAQSQNSESGGVIGLSPISDPLLQDLATHFSGKISLYLPLTFQLLATRPRVSIPMKRLTASSQVTTMQRTLAVDSVLLLLCPKMMSRTNMSISSDGTLPAMTTQRPQTLNIPCWISKFHF